ncbi:MAG: hypothetical protein PHY93_12880, partial [Bacteriovorax sp.]|nr:hypothetical protein [Bacteriovorax sp.]
CKVIFIKGTVPDEIKSHLKNKFTSVFSLAENKSLLIDLIHIGSLNEITNEKWKPFQELLEGVKNFAIKSFAKVIIVNE